jgi:hypothetical protein
VVAHGVTVKGESRQSKFMWSMWPSDKKPRSWSISCPGGVNRLYVNRASLGSVNNPL